MMKFMNIFQCESAVVGDGREVLTSQFYDQCAIASWLDMEAVSQGILAQGCKYGFYLRAAKYRTLKP